MSNAQKSPRPSVGDFFVGFRVVGRSTTPPPRLTANRRWAAASFDLETIFLFFAKRLDKYFKV